MVFIFGCDKLKYLIFFWTDPFFKLLCESSVIFARFCWMNRENSIWLLIKNTYLLFSQFTFFKFKHLRITWNPIVLYTLQFMEGFYLLLSFYSWERLIIQYLFILAYNLEFTNLVPDILVLLIFAHYTQWTSLRLIIMHNSFLFLFSF
jgi:hypothetical protein